MPGMSVIVLSVFSGVFMVMGMRIIGVCVLVAVFVKMFVRVGVSVLVTVLHIAMAVLV